MNRFCLQLEVNSRLELFNFIFGKSLIEIGKDAFSLQRCASNLSPNVQRTGRRWVLVVEIETFSFSKLNGWVKGKRGREGGGVKSIPPPHQKKTKHNHKPTTTTQSALARCTYMRKRRVRMRMFHANFVLRRIFANTFYPFEHEQHHMCWFLLSVEKISE